MPRFVRAKTWFFGMILCTCVHWDRLTVLIKAVDNSHSIVFNIMQNVSLNKLKQEKENAGAILILVSAEKGTEKKKMQKCRNSKMQN